MSYCPPCKSTEGSRIPSKRTQTTKKSTPSETSITTITTVTQSGSSSNVRQSGLRQPGFHRQPTGVRPGVCPSAVAAERQPPRQPPRQLPRQPPPQQQTVIKKTSSTTIEPGRKKVVTTTRTTRNPPGAAAGGSRSGIPGARGRGMSALPGPSQRGPPICPGTSIPGAPSGSGRSVPSTSSLQSVAQYQQYGYPAPPQQVSKSRLPRTNLPRPGPLGQVSEKTVLENKVERELYKAASRLPGKIVKASAAKTSAITPPIMMTPKGQVQAQEQILMERIVERTPGSEKISRRMVGIEKQGCCRAIRTEVDMQRLEPGGLSTDPGSPLREVISISSSVTISPQGLKEKTSTVTYEKTSPIPEGPSAAQVSRMVAEETHDVDKAMKLTPLELKVLSPVTYGIKKREHELLLNKSSVGRLEQAVKYPEPCADREQEELQPEMMATIMHTEEKGVAMGAQPIQIYDYLFPEAKEPEVIEVSSVVPAPLQDVMVPVELPENFYANALSQDLEQAILNAEQAGGTKPTANVFSENIVRTDKERKPVLKNVAKRGSKKKVTEIPVLAEELPPWGIEDLQPIIDLVGAVPNTTLIADLPEEASTSIKEQENCQGIEYMLQMEPPSHASRVQLRGSQRPPWFPGYIVAFPDVPDLIQVVNTPTSVLSTAWRAVQPRTLAEKSFLVI